MILAPITDDYSGEWIASPRCLEQGVAERTVITARAAGVLECFGTVTDADACYSFDDWALVRCHGEFYLLNTSGCSCPNPVEEWGVQVGPVSLEEIRTYLIDAAGKNGFGVTSRQHREFMALVEAAEASEAVSQIADALGGLAEKAVTK